MTRAARGQALWYVIVYIAMAAGVVASALVYYHHEKGAVRRQAEEHLAAIARLKVQEIADWRRERLADATIVQHSTFFQAAARQVLAGKPDPANEKLLRERMELYVDAYRYAAVAVVDAAGEVRFGTAEADPLHTGEDRAALAEALGGRRILFTDVHRHEPSGRVVLSLIVPVLAGDAPPAGAVVLQIDPASFLYPFVQSWPVPSGSAETLLVRRDGDDILFLNDLRHRSGTALALRFPLSRSDLPAAMAVAGREGIVAGRDYRGRAVLAAVGRIPGSPWFLVAKVDEAEVMAPLAARFWGILGIVVAVLVAGGIADLALWRRQHSEAELAVRRESERQLAVVARRSELLLELSKLHGQSVREVTSFALEACVELTGSQAGFFHFFDEATGEIKLNIWSKEVMPECLLNQDQHYPLDRAGIWADCVRRREPVIVNDYHHEAGRKGYPEGHFPVRNFMSVPVFEGNRIVMICGVGNKETAFAPSDVDEVQIFMISAWSIIKQLLAEEELERSRTLLDAMGAIGRVGGWEVDLATMQQVWTKETYAIHEVEPDTRPDVEKGIGFYAPEAQQTIRELFERAATAGTPFDAELPFITARGNRLWVRVMGEAVREGGNIARVRGVFQDITYRKKAEQQLEHYAQRMEQMADERLRELEKARQGLYAQERLSALGRMGAGIAHQFNTPIGAGMLYVDALLERCTGMHEQHELLGKVRGLFEDMKQVVDSMLALARVRKRGQAEVAPTEVNGVLERVLDMCTMECNAREVRVEPRLAEGLPPIPAGVGELEQVFVNLVTNAIDAMAAGGVLTVESAPSEGGAVVRVRDTGRGIPPENLGKIFEPFFTTMAGGRGTGLGLAIAHDIVERYGGRIEVVSEVGAGTTFTVWLPPTGIREQDLPAGNGDKG